jgi:FHS family glucose/mannose:H+ symporter-like MFS transporter
MEYFSNEVFHKIIIVDFLKNKESKQQFLISYAVFLLNGMLALSIGSLLPFIRDARGLDYAFCGMIVSLHSVGNLCSSFIAGILPIWLGRKRSILLFNSFFAVAFLFIIQGNNKICLVLAFFMTGLARGATSNFANTAINRLAPGKAWALNGLHAMFSVGAFLFPLMLIVMTMSDAGRWIYACFFMLGAGILSWILYFIIPLGKEDGVGKKRTNDKKNDFGFFKESLFYLCTATLFFYLCAEQGVIGWLITYFKDTGLLSASVSQVMASVLWVMILAGRLTVAWLSTKMKKTKMLFIMGVGFAVFAFVLLISRSTPLIVIGIMGFGYSMAGIYPTTVSFAGKLIAKYEIAWSFILTIASLGSILMPSIIGRIANVAGIAAGMKSIIIVVVVDLVLILGLVMKMRKTNE